MYREGPRNEGAPELYLTSAEVEAWRAYGFASVPAHLIVSLIVGYYFTQTLLGGNSAAATAVFNRAVTNWGGATAAVAAFMRLEDRERYLKGDDKSCAPLMAALKRSGWSKDLAIEPDTETTLTIGAHAAWEVLAVNDHATMATMCRLITILRHNGFAGYNVSRTTERRMVRAEIGLGLTGNRRRDHPALIAAREAAATRIAAASPEASKPIKKVAWWQTPWPWVGVSILLTLLNLAQCAANG